MKQYNKKWTSNNKKKNKFRNKKMHLEKLRAYRF